MKSGVKLKPRSAILYLRRRGPEEPQLRAWIIGAMRGKDDRVSLRRHVDRFTPPWELVGYRFSGGRLVRLLELTQAEVDAAEGTLPW